MTTETVVVERSDQPLTKAEFIEQGDAICAGYDFDEMGEEAKDLAEDLEAGAAGASEELADLFDQAADLEQEELEKLRELNPPPGDVEIIDSMLEEVQAQVQIVREVADALREDDFDEFTERGRESENVGNKAKGIAQGYGFENCGSNDP